MTIVSGLMTIVSILMTIVSGLMTIGTFGPSIGLFLMTVKAKPIIITPDTYIIDKQLTPPARPTPTADYQILTFVFTRTFTRT